MNLEDTYRHKGLRKKLVDTIREKGIKDEKVLQAIEKIPRHYFFDSAFLPFAYEDKAFPIGAGQTISQPFTVAFQSELLEIKRATRYLRWALAVDTRPVSCRRWVQRCSASNARKAYFLR